MEQRVVGYRQAGARRALLSILFAGSLLSASLNVLSPLKAQIQAELRCTDAQTALPVSATQVSSLVAAALSSLFLSRKGLNRRLILTISSAVVSVATCLIASVPSIGHLCLLRVFVGGGYSIAIITFPSVLVDYYPTQDRSYVIAFYQLSFLLGGAFSYAMAAVIAEAAGWRLAVLAVGVPCLIAGLALQFIREPKQGVNDTVDSVVDEETSSLWAKYRSMFSNLHFLTAAAVGSMSVFAESSAADWFPTFLQRFDGQNVQAAGLECACAAMLGAFLGSSIGAKATKAFDSYTKNVELLAPALGIVASSWACVICLDLRIHSAVVIVVLAAAYMSSFTLSNVCLTVLVAKIFPSSQISLAVSTQTLCTGFATAMSPVLTGKLSDKTHSLKASLHLPLVVQLSAGLLLFISARCLPAVAGSCHPDDKPSSTSLLSLFATDDEHEPDVLLDPEQKTKSQAYGSLEPVRNI